MGLLRRSQDVQSPESSPGSPAYDARIDPLVSPMEIVGSERLQAARDVHLFDSKSAPALAFSHAFESSPSPLGVQIASLAAARDQIERIVSRKDLPPFPGVELGHVPAFAPSPRTDPVLQGFAHFAHGAHLGPSRDLMVFSREGRRRFGH